MVALTPAPVLLLRPSTSFVARAGLMRMRNKHLTCHLMCDRFDFTMDQQKPSFELSGTLTERPTKLQTCRKLYMLTMLISWSTRSLYNVLYTCGSVRILFSKKTPLQILILLIHTSAILHGLMLLS